MISLSKAEMLTAVSEQLKIFIVPELVYFTVKDFLENREQKLLDIQKKLFRSSDFLAIRSSSLEEDGVSSSNAGKFDSFLNVPKNDKKQIEGCIDSVVVALKKSDNYSELDQIIIQSMVNDVAISGVLLSHELGSNAPYYVINYDDISGKTDTVTAGNSELSNQSLYVHRDKTYLIRSARFKLLLKATFELQKLLANEFIDLEFAINGGGDVFLLQVRPIANSLPWDEEKLMGFKGFLDEAAEFLSSRLDREPLRGSGKTLFGQMPDWNPAEILGKAPKRLSFSLYKHLITDKIWADARELMHYTRPDNDHLMLEVAGHAFVDVGISLLSFIPAQVSENIKCKLVKHWISVLRERPELHDKIEFEVAVTCFSFDFDARLLRLTGNALSEAERNELSQAYRDQLLVLISQDGEHSASSALDKINILNNLQSEPLYFGGPQDYETFRRIIQDCKCFGTTPFAVLARYAFIAKTLLQSLEHVGLLTESEVHIVLNSVETVTADFLVDFEKVVSGVKEEAEFWKIYGHLRPGSYDITSPRYDSISNFFSHAEPSCKHSAKVKLDDSKLNISAKRINKINDFFREQGFSYFDWSTFSNFVVSSIEAREYSKFVFSRSLSQILEFISSYSQDIGISREDAAFLSLEQFFDLLENETDKRMLEIVKASVEREKTKNELSGYAKLPQILGDVTGSYIAPFQSGIPNFITKKLIIAEAIFLDASMIANKEELTGKIAIIESADPGFDWLFAHDIAGLITEFGGANSHMAIRSAELDLPAAIGCGKNIFGRLKDARRIRLDCASGFVTALN